MDLNHIVSFLRVVEAGSFTGAAKALGVPTSTVSRQIAQLEETLGVRLLQRTSRHVQLTDAGVAYHERVAPALASLVEASSEIHDLQAVPSGLVRLTAPSDLSVDYLAMPLADFAREYPRIQIELALTGRTVDLVAEGFDLALRAGEIRDGSLIARKLALSEIIVVASEGYLARRGEPTSFTELGAHDAIGFRAQRGRVSWSLVGPEGPVSVELDCRISADDFSFVRALLHADAGVALAPRALVQAGLLEGKLRRILPGYSLQLSGGLYLVYPSAKHLPRRVALLRDHLLRVLPATLTPPFLGRDFPYHRRGPGKSLGRAPVVCKTSRRVRWHRGSGAALTNKGGHSVMSERGSRKIPVTERQFLWVQDDDKGEVILHVGPTMVSPTAADRVVVDDGQGGFREATSAQPQRMIELSDSQYAVLHNPLLEQEDGPNGRFRPGRNESKGQRNGTRAMIPGPCSFYLRPGQRVEVRDAHELASNQYLVVKVYGEVDKGAPYYEITAKSAAITTATAEDVTSPTKGLTAAEPVDLSRGQLIVIRGLDTQFYIPPSGVDVVPDLSFDDRQITAAAARKILGTIPAAPPPEPPPPPAYQQNAEYEEQFQQRQEKRKGPSNIAPMPAAAPAPKVDQSVRNRQVVQRSQSESAAPREPEELSEDDVQMLLSSDIHRQALEREVRKRRLVREAVVLGEKEFCVILDADGKRQIKQGPARVFPGPYDTFLSKGSNNRIYSAYELLPQRALWLRFISPIPREQLVQRVPRGVKLESDRYHPGDELVLTGVNSFFFPFNEIEILHPLTGQPHVGNDHSDVFIEAIGIDQKSGIYVRDLSTGEVRLVRGKQSYLVDPRKEVHITRTLSAEDWNLWVTPTEPHKATQKAITTPWAVSVNIPHNMAIMAASADGQRVIQGPCVDLLLYQETLVALSLSTGTPKSDSKKLRTVFLRTVGNQISDIIRIETADFVQIDVRVSYRVNFHPDHKERWFNHEDYIGVLTDHLRSLVRSRCRAIALSDLWANLSNIIRDIILGERQEGGGRKGRLFDENGMHVIEVEVLASEILDKEIAGLLESVQRESVSMHIGDRQTTEQLRSEKLRHDIERERLELRRETQERQSRVDEILRTLEQGARLSEMRATLQAEREKAEMTAAHNELVLQAQLKRDGLSLQSTLDKLQKQAIVEVEALNRRHEEERLHQKALHDLQLQLLDAQSHATVAERQAIQPALVEALSGLGDKILLGEVAANMNLVSLFKGKDVATLFSDILGGTKVGQTIAAMMPDKKDKKLPPPRGARG